MLKEEKNFNVKLLTCRKVDNKDSEILFNRFNEKESIKNSIKTKKEITFKEHSSWFSKVIKDDKIEIFIFEYNSIPIGNVRLKLFYGEKIISYNVDKKYRNLGIGKAILKKILNLKYSNNFNYVAKVNPNNIPSLNIFNYLKFESAIKNGIYFFTKNTKIKK